MIPCSVRTFGECTCQPHECRAAHPTKAKEAPIRFSVRDQFMVCAFVGVIAGIAAFAIAARAEPVLKIQDLVNQEVNAYVYRR